MMKKNPRQQPLTVGELCYAIAEGRLPVTLHDNQWYQVNARELRRFADRRQTRSGYDIPRIARPIK
ncbi:MAG TPA: hypothetical protein VF099_02040 [Ktedonobacterales bacterium]